MGKIIVEYREGKHFLKDVKGNLIIETGFDWIDNAMEPEIQELTEEGDTATLTDSEIEWIHVTLNEKENLINKRGEYISEIWFDEIFPNGEKWIEVIVDEKSNLINKNGKYISAEWFDSIDNFFENHDWIPVTIGDKQNLINDKGEYLLDKPVDAISEFEGEWASISIKGKANLINRDRKYFSKEWFDDIEPFDEGWAFVQQHKKWNLINEAHEYFVEEWFEFKRFEDGSREKIFPTGGLFSDGWMRIYRNGKYNYINRERKYISKEGFDNAEDFALGEARVENDGKRYFLYADGTLNPHEEDWEPFEITRIIDRHEN